MSNLPELEMVNGLPMASSLDVATHFEKDHHNVLKAIRSLIDELPAEFNGVNFNAIEYRDPVGRTQPMFYLSRDAFTLLAMGFTGAAALQWKLKYIEAFNAMAETIFHIEDISLPWATPPVMAMLTRLPTFMHREYFRALIAVYTKLAPEEADKRSRKLLDVCRVFACKARTQQGSLLDVTGA